MRKLIVTLIGLTISCANLQAQISIEDSIGITRERWRDSLFRMDMQFVPTGILLEYSLFPFESIKHDGLNNNDDTLKHAGQLYMLHNILTESLVNENMELPETDSLFAKAMWINFTTGKMPFTLVYQEYNRIRETSLSEGLFTIHADSMGILDVLPRAVSPYDTNYAFFAAPFETVISQNGPIAFYFPDSLWQMPGITSISVDFGDGTGAAL